MRSEEDHMNLVFIHGAGGSSRTWELQKRNFTNYQVEMIDLPGHGRRAGEGRESIREYVEKVRALIQGLEDVVLIGHSMGGAITMTYALTYPLQACVLAGTGARLRVLPAILEQVRENYETTVDLILEYAVYHKTDEIMKHSKEEMLKTSPEITYRDFLACNNFDVMGEIGKLNIPTLVICGDQDMMTPPKYSEYLAAKIPKSQLKIIKDCGHMLMLERPQEFNETLEEFLKGLASR